MNLAVPSIPFLFSPFPLLFFLFSLFPTLPAILVLFPLPTFPFTLSLFLFLFFYPFTGLLCFCFVLDFFLPPPLPTTSLPGEVLTNSVLYVRRTKIRFSDSIIPKACEIFKFNPNPYNAIDIPIPYHRKFILTVSQDVHSFCRRWPKHCQHLLCKIHLALRSLTVEWFLNVYLLYSLNKQD